MCIEAVCYKGFAFVTDLFGAQRPHGRNADGMLAACPQFLCRDASIKTGGYRVSTRVKL